MPSIFLSIVIPVYNEEQNIVQVINDHVAVLSRGLDSVTAWEIICLDDASTDQTHQLLASMAQQVSGLKVIRHDQNQGIDATFADLFRAAQGDFIYATGGDGQWPAENCQRLWDRARATSADLVIGVRQNRDQVYSWWRQTLSYGFNLVPELLFNVQTEDANGIKLGRREIFQAALLSRSFFAEIERILKAKDKGFKIEFAPILFLPRSAGKAKGAKWRNIFATTRDLIKYLIIKKRK